MIKKRFFIIIPLLFFGMVLLSKDISIENARTVAINFLDKKEYNIKMECFQNPMKIKDLYYTFDLQPGYIIIAANDLVYPVLAYSLDNSIDVKHPPPAFSFWMKQFKNQIKNNTKPAGYVSQAWEKYLSKDPFFGKSTEGINPLITSSWDQGIYYNSAFPLDSSFSSNHPYAGCVAVAMSQIMNYYNWPETGKGENTINSPYGDLTANFGNTTYNWIAMESYLDKENEAVAELIYHSAISVNSLFFPTGTGAYDFDIPHALIDNFRYSESTEFIFKHQYTGDWEELIINELTHNRPLIYGGIDLENSVGHTFVCDGYQDESYFHFNWGWGGQYNGYYYLDSLIVAGYHYDYQHDVVIGIKPDIEGIVEIYPPENLIAEVDFHDVQLSWHPPSITGTLALLGYQVFRNDTLLTNSIITTTGFTDYNAPQGNHTYKVTTSYIGANNGPAVETEVFISDIEYTIAEQIKIYPNPNQGKFKIELGDLGQNFEMTLYNINGIILSQHNSTSGITNNKLSIDDLQAGVYLLKLVSTNQVFTSKVMVK